MVLYFGFVVVWVGDYGKNSIDVGCCVGVIVQCCCNCDFCFVGIWVGDVDDFVVVFIGYIVDLGGVVVE